MGLRLRKRGHEPIGQHEVVNNTLRVEAVNRRRGT